MNTERTFNAIFWALFVLMFLIRFSFGFRVWRTGERLTAQRGAHQREGLWAHVTGYLFWLLLAALFLLWFQGDGLRRFAFPAPDWLRWTGFGLGMASVGLFAWTHAVLGRFLSSYLQLRPGHRLLTDGPYSRIRHPMYSAIVGWMTSLGLVAPNWLAFVFAALAALHFMLRIQGEEQMMLQQFGDEYREYMKRTGRLLPGRNDTAKEEVVSARTNRWVIAAAVAALILGAILSRVIEPGVRVEKIMLTTNTPALRLFPATPGPHPIALLAHGNGASKEMMFRFAEALAAAGFDCYSVDQAGYGESPQSCSLTNLRRNFLEAERALGEVDVFIGHSMGSASGSWSVREAGFRPKLFIGVGNTAKLGERGPPLLLLFGRFDEFTVLFGTSLKAQTNARVVISPWSDHLLEAFDPVLVNAAVRAACATVDKPVPAAPTAWRLRLAGLVLGIAGASVLMFRLPDLHPRLAGTRRFIVPAVLLIAIVLTMGTWVGVTPQLRRIPQQLVLLVFIWLALAGLSRLRLPRWSLAVVTGIVALACLPFVAYLPYPRFEKGIFLCAHLMCTFGGGMVSLLAGAAVGRIATRGGSRRDGDVAMAIFASYAIGQFMPLFY